MGVSVFIATLVLSVICFIKGCIYENSFYKDNFENEMMGTYQEFNKFIRKNISAIIFTAVPLYLSVATMLFFFKAKISCSGHDLVCICRGFSSGLIALLILPFFIYLIYLFITCASIEYLEKVTLKREKKHSRLKIFITIIATMISLRIVDSFLPSEIRQLIYSKNDLQIYFLCSSLLALIFIIKYKLKNNFIYNKYLNSNPREEVKNSVKVL